MCAIAVLGLLFAEYNNTQLGRYLCKPVASLAFIVAAFHSGANLGGYAWWIVAALLCSAVGDVLLIPKSVTAFRLGILAFAAAHLLFIVAFWMRSINLPSAAVALVPLGILGFLIARMLVPRVDSELRGPVIGYAIILTLMLSAAIGTVAERADWALLAGAVLFYVSDLTVARDKFLREAFINRFLGLPLYYAAQLLFAATVR